jgi:hypothetical protein
VYEDVGYYNSNEDAVKAITAAKTKPSFIVNSSPNASFDGRLAFVSSATGCKPLPEDGSFDKKIARSYIDDLHFSGRISSSSAKRYSDLIEAGSDTLGVLKDAFLSKDKVEKTHKNAAQQGAWFSGTAKVSSDRSALEVATKQALEKGVSLDKVQSKLATCIPTAEAMGMVRSILSGMQEVEASCLPKCSIERYHLHKTARIKMSSKCQGCVSRSCTSCLSQGLKFAGAVDYDKAFIDMSVLTASDNGKKAKKPGPANEVSSKVKGVVPSDDPDSKREDMKQMHERVSDKDVGDKAKD